MLFPVSRMIIVYVIIHIIWSAYQAVESDGIVLREEGHQGLQGLQVCHQLFCLPGQLNSKQLDKRHKKLTAAGNSLTRTEAFSLNLDSKCVRCNMWQTENSEAAIHGKLKIAEMRNVENEKTAGIQHVANF
jgi:hypothetical protein